MRLAVFKKLEFLLPLLVLCAPLRSQTIPPRAPVRPVTNVYFGTEVVDPYRYMEDLQDPQVQTWMKAQAEYTRQTLDSIPGRKQVLADIVKYDDSPIPEVRLPLSANGLLFYQKRIPPEDEPKVYVRRGLRGKERMLIDLQELSNDKRHVAVSSMAPSWDGKYVAIGLSAGGSEMATLHVYEVVTGQEIGTPIDRVHFGGAMWLPRKYAFYYNRLRKLDSDAPQTELYQKTHIFLHWLRKDPEQDPMIFGESVSSDVQIDPVMVPGLLTAPNSGVVVGIVQNGVAGAMRLYTAPILEDGMPGTWKRLTDFSDEVWDVALAGDALYLTSAKAGPHFKVLRTKAAHPDLAASSVFFSPGEDVIMTTWVGKNALYPAKDALYVAVFNGASSALMRVPYDEPSDPQKIPLPWSGSLLGGTSDPRLPGVLVELTGWTHNGGIYEAKPGAQTLSATGLNPAGLYTDPEDLVSEDVEVRAADGIMIPLSIVHKKGLARNGSNPTLLSGYGAYGIPQLPSYSPGDLAWLERGGVAATAHVRGGGEFGEEWHRAGQMSTKPNTWNDFIACAKYLVSQQYTSPAKLGIWGGSAGGIMIGRAVTEAPGLFAAAITPVPVTDNLRSETSSNGIRNIPEFGSVKTEEGFRDLYAMSSYAHVKDGIAYPAMMVETGINDARVQPWHSAKLVARLQAANSGKRPTLLRIDYESGHGVEDTSKQYHEELADNYTFLLWQMGDPAFQPAPN